MWPAISDPMEHPDRLCDREGVDDRAGPKGRTALLRFARHYVEMVVAMVAGMVVLGPVELLLTSALGHPEAMAGATVMTFVMAANMTVAMVGWMGFRRHRPRLIAEMAVGMNLPLAIIVPLQVGMPSDHAVSMSGHLLMFLGMSVAMLLRRQEYLRRGR